ncbi:MAG: hypothetical protein IPJ38_15000 [Dechloromonas sp.]|uniref:Uncharacterized protein n=1 Tax=Candidatus Dechloromonas phosphorivorans TaxID=2899244 RepID=A0A935JYV0_9RHOO|nr:hypothetical protein [Candidatus Dechloromonas phosphorivorans]
MLKRVGAYASKNAKDFDLSSYGVWCKRIDAALLVIPVCRKSQVGLRGRFFDHSPHLYNMISHLGVYKRSLVESVGGFRDEFVGSQDYDLALRCIEQTAVENIAHIPNVLYHWRIHDSGTAKSGDADPMPKMQRLER